MAVVKQAVLEIAKEVVRELAKDRVAVNVREAVLVIARGVVIPHAKAVVVEEQGNFKEYRYDFFSDINQKSANDIIDFVLSHNDMRRLSLYINSTGGLVSAALAISNFFKLLKNVSVKTYNIGQCASAAVILYSIGSERICYKNATFYFHSLETTLCGKQTVTTLEEEIKQLKQAKLNTIQTISENTNIKPSKISKMFSDKGVTLNAIDSLKLSFSTKII